MKNAIARVLTVLNIAMVGTLIRKSIAIKKKCGTVNATCVRYAKNLWTLRMATALIVRLDFCTPRGNKPSVIVAS